MISLIKTGMIFASVIFSVILISGSIIPSYSEYLSPKKQLESGVLPEDVICRDDKVLVIRDNGNPACVTERTVEKTGWEIIKTVFFTDNKIKENEPDIQNSKTDSPKIIETTPTIDDINATKQNYDNLNFSA